ncbi:MAG: pyridoxine 5'-phosphate synthase [Planctomycetota bacterium]|nr:pyridoxine 5'-phosphate synthase [Planctomycetota bacterium]MDA1113369.1 pyridoxine 5'-phosphate synthase [Planctomycetota bacterium]
MPRLHVNIDHVATLRQARLSQEPDPVIAAGICELAGANGITVHLREDRRHIQERDVRILKQTVKTLLNLEMAWTKEMLDFAMDLKPNQICVVPEKREELTTEGGLDVGQYEQSLSEEMGDLQKAGIEVSLFIDPLPDAIECAARAGADFVELHTGSYANARGKNRLNELKRLETAANYAHELGLRVNAGHGLDFDNVLPIAQLPWVEELNIGYAIICRSIYSGLDQAVREMQDRILAAAPPDQE